VISVHISALAITVAVTGTVQIPVISITTTDISNITSNSTSSGGTITSNGGYEITQRGVCWSTNSQPTISNNYTTDGAGIGIFSSSITVLNPNATYYVRAYASNSEGTSYGNELDFTTTTQTWQCGDSVFDTRDSSYYNTVLIGNQCWMSENMNIGIRINGNQNQSENNTIEKYCFENIESNCDTYGGLYQWDEMMQYETIEGSQGICPSNWHIATDDDWKQLEMNQGMSQTQTDVLGWRGTDEGEKMKSTTGWNDNGNGTNSSGLTVIPSGIRHTSSNYHGLRELSFIWTSTNIQSTLGLLRGFYFNRDNIARSYLGYNYSLSVRCLHD